MAAAVAVPPASVCAAPVEAAPATATVRRVIDSDTVDVVDDVRGRLRVRVLGIDTSETKRPGLRRGVLGWPGHRARHDDPD